MHEMNVMCTFCIWIYQGVFIDVLYLVLLNSSNNELTLAILMYPTQNGAYCIVRSCLRWKINDFGIFGAGHHLINANRCFYVIIQIVITSKNKWLDVYNYRPKKWGIVTSISLSPIFSPSLFSPLFLHLSLPLSHSHSLSLFFLSLSAPLFFSLSLSLSSSFSLCFFVLLNLSFSLSFSSLSLSPSLSPPLLFFLSISTLSLSLPLYLTLSPNISFPPFLPPFLSVSLPLCLSVYLSISLYLCCPYPTPSSLHVFPLPFPSPNPSIIPPSIRRSPIPSHSLILFGMNSFTLYLYLCTCFPMYMSPYT